MGKNLSLEQVDSLERPSDEEEIKCTVFPIAAEKAPGLDGFTMAFFQHSWEIVKADLVEVPRQFHLQGQISEGLNSNFIILIQDFPPISLISSPYKIIAKVPSTEFKRFFRT